MIFTETKLKGAFIIDIQKNEDERGFFARSYCFREFEAHGLNPRVVQCNISYNGKKGTLRGMHYQVPPFEEAKLVRCTRGSIYDVIVDLRPDSETYCEWLGVFLSSPCSPLTAHGSLSPAPSSLLTANCSVLTGDGLPLTEQGSLVAADCSGVAAHRSLLPAHYTMFYIPEGFAHGFITLENHTEVFYQMSEFYAPDSSAGFRWNDPAFAIEWPLEPAVISERDTTYPDFSRKG